MPLSLSDIRNGRQPRPPRVMIYGPPGLGKTTLSAEFPAPVFIQLEDGFPLGVDVPHWSRDQVVNYDGVLDALSALITDDHDRQTVIIDSLDKLEPLVWAKTCERCRWNDIEQPGYGKGYLATDTEWREILMATNALRLQKEMTVIFVAHSHVVTAPDPVNVEYQRYDIRLHKRALAMFQDEMDMILFLNQDVTVLKDNERDKDSRVRGAGSGSRVIYTSPRPAFVAKNRFGMPDKIAYQVGKGYSAIAQFLGGDGAAVKNAA